MDNANEQEKKGFIKDTMRKFSLHIPGNESSLASKISQYEAEIGKLQDQIKTLEDESEGLLRNLEKTINQYEVLKRKYYQTSEQMNNGRKQNEKLAAALQDAKNQIVALKEEIDKLCAPPNSYGTFRKVNEDGTIDISLDGRTLKVNVHPKINAKELREGQLVILNEAYNVIEVAGYEVKGEVVHIKDFVDENRAIVIGRADEEMVVQLSEPLKRDGMKVGDNVMLDPRSGYAVERLPKSDVEEVVLEEVPNVTYDDIGGLGDQIEALRDAIELPYLYPDEFREHRLSPPKGILLYGPPGCGKTLIAKAVANSLAEKIEKRTGKKTTAYFLNVKGPELLNKYVEVTYAKGDKEIFYFKDFASGAMIENIVARAKKIALKRFIAGGEKGLSFVDLQDAVEGEYKENEDLPNTTNPDDWARISGRKGEKIINVRTLMGGGSPKLRSIEDISGGQYL